MDVTVKYNRAQMRRQSFLDAQGRSALFRSQTFEQGLARARSWWPQLQEVKTLQTRSGSRQVGKSKDRRAGRRAARCPAERTRGVGDAEGVARLEILHPNAGNDMSPRGDQVFLS